MRVFLLLTAAWGLWASPVLCESGLLTACCELSCTEDCETDCECHGCAELCNARVTKPSSGSELPDFSATHHVATLPPFASAYADSYWSEFLDPVPIGFWKLSFPFPVSDRPLLV